VADHGTGQELLHNLDADRVLTDVAPRPRWSYSALNQIGNICALQYRFQRIDKLEPEHTAQALLYGSSVHEAASWLYRLRKERSPILTAEIQEIFAESMKRNVAQAARVQYEDGDSLDSLVREGRELLGLLVESQPDDEVIVDVDVPFELPIRHSSGAVLDKPLVGELDLVVGTRGESAVRVKDLKTARKRYTEEKLRHDLQATAYTYALRQLYPDRASAEFQWDVLVKNKRPVVERYETSRGPDDFDRLFALAQTADKLIESGAFLPNRSSFFCKSCPFQSACDRWGA